MKVFVVTSGEYSSYGINGVCISKEAAQSFIRREIEEDRQRYVKAYEELKNSLEEQERVKKAFGEEGLKSRSEWYAEVIRDWNPEQGGGQHYNIEEYEVYE